LNKKSRTDARVNSIYGGGGGISLQSIGFAEIYGPMSVAVQRQSEQGRVGGSKPTKKR